jgi:pimeloyl-ACP methyl ester carboxylesterase
MLSIALLAALVQSPGEVRPITITVGELTFDALTAGPRDGEPVILLHGFPQTSHAFRSELAALGEAGYRAVAPDQRGYSPGARPDGVAPYAMTELVGDVFRIAGALKMDRFHLVGHDWGGAVAWVAAGVRPDRIRTLTVLSTPHYAALSAGRARQGSDQADRSAYFNDFAAPDAATRMLADNAASLRQILGAIDSEAREVYLEALGTEPALRAALAWYRAAFGGGPATGSASPPPPPAPITTPTLYIWGEQDGAFGPGTARATAEWVSGPYRFVPLPGMGHWLPEQAADTVNAELLAHLARHR